MSEGKEHDSLTDSFNFLLSGVEHFLMPEALKHATALMEGIKELEQRIFELEKEVEEAERRGFEAARLVRWLQPAYEGAECGEIPVYRTFDDYKKSRKEG